MPRGPRAHLLNPTGAQKLIQRVDVTYLSEGPDGAPVVSAIEAYKDQGAVLPLEDGWRGTPAEVLIRATVADALGGGQVQALTELNSALLDMVRYTVGQLTGPDGAAKIGDDGQPVLTDGFLAAYRHLMDEVLTLQPEGDAGAGS